MKIIKKFPACFVAFIVLAHANSSDCRAVDIEWVTVGDPGNAADDTRFGAVDYTYRIGKFEVTNTQYADFLNAVAADDTHALYDRKMDIEVNRFGGIARNGVEGGFTYSAQEEREDKPVVFVSFWTALRFANWMHNGQSTGPQNSATTEDGAYTLTADGMSTNSITRNADALVFLPNENEWYKAAYYKGQGRDAGYWEYPTQSDLQPIAEAPPGGSSSSNHGNVLGEFTDVGAYVSSPSAYGTFDQGGNAWEWHEDVVAISRRGARGGGTLTSQIDLAASIRVNRFPNRGAFDGGFRLAAVPEPRSLGLAGCGLLILASCRRTTI